MVTLQLALEEIQGDWFGWIETFPGAYSQGLSPQEAERFAPAALSDYLAWLRGHEEPTPPSLFGLTSAEIHIEVCEIHRAQIGPDGGEINGFFVSDALSVEADELEVILRLLTHARADLEKAARALPPDQWDMAPFGGKTVRSLLYHIARTELSLFSRLGFVSGILPPSDPLSLLDTVRQELLRCLPDLLDRQREGEMLADGERWTLRKALRRALWHERYHTAQIAQRTNPSDYLRAVVSNVRWTSTPFPTRWAS